jgi:hypothetical protein
LLLFAGAGMGALLFSAETWLDIDLDPRPRLAIMQPLLRSSSTAQASQPSIAMPSRTVSSSSPSSASSEQ